jgi:hypothetical protein
MADEFSSAIAALRQKLSEQHRNVADTKRSINLLLKMAGREPEYAEDDDPSSSEVRPDQFYGKGLASSAAEYLGIRKQACQPVEILRALETGGFDFDMLPWKKDDRLRSFALSLAKNTGIAGKFHRLKNGSFGLRSWYDADFLKKAAAGPGPAIESGKKKRGRPPKVRPTVDQVSKVKGEIPKGAPQTLCSRGCGKAPHRGSCAKSSVKDKEPSGDRPDGSER